MDSFFAKPTLAVRIKAQTTQIKNVFFSFCQIIDLHKKKLINQSINLGIE